MARKIGRPVIRTRRPASLYRTPDGVTTVEFEIPGYAGFPPCSGLITLTRDQHGARIEVTHVDYLDHLVVAGPFRDPNQQPELANESEADA